MLFFGKIDTMHPVGLKGSHRRELRKGLMRRWDAPVHLFRVVVQRVYLWQYRVQYRHELARLDSHTLKDIGLSRHRVREEATKLFWQK